MTGRLFVKILLPEAGNRVVRTVGGPWHEFEVEGVNYGPTEDTYAEQVAAASAGARPREQHRPGGVADRTVAPGHPRRHELPRGLHAADRATGNMIPVEGIERPGQMGAKVTVGTTDYEVIFATAGPTGGHIRVTQAGKTTLDRPLAAAVEDNYRKWSADPRYEAWMTRPEYRNFMGNSTAETLGPPSLH